jgi:hypothetical protein
MFMAIRTHESESIADPNGVNDTNAAAATNDDKYRLTHAAETDSKPRKRCFAANAQGLVGAKQSRPCVLDQR